MLVREIIDYLGGATPTMSRPQETALLGYDRGVLRQEVRPASTIIPGCDACGAAWHRDLK